MFNWMQFIIAKNSWVKTILLPANFSLIMLDIEPPVVICDKEEMIKASIKNEIIIKASSLNGCKLQWTGKWIKEIEKLKSRWCKKCDDTQIELEAIRTYNNERIGGKLMMNEQSQLPVNGLKATVRVLLPQINSSKKCPIITVAKRKYVVVNKDCQLVRWDKNHWKNAT